MGLVKPILRSCPVHLSVSVLLPRRVLTQRYRGLTAKQLSTDAKMGRFSTSPLWITHHKWRRDVRRTNCSKGCCHSGKLMEFLFPSMGMMLCASLLKNVRHSLQKCPHNWQTPGRKIKIKSTLRLNIFVTWTVTGASQSLRHGMKIKMFWVLWRETSRSILPRRETSTLLSLWGFTLASQCTFTLLKVPMNYSACILWKLVLEQSNWEVMISTPLPKILKPICWLRTRCLSLWITLMTFGLYLGRQMDYALDHGTLKMKSKLMSITTFGTWISFHTLVSPAGTKHHGRYQMVNISLYFFLWRNILKDQ